MSEAVSDTVDAFRERERDAWRAFLASGSVEALLAHHAALGALNGEIDARVQLLIKGGRVQMSGRRVS